MSGRKPAKGDKVRVIYEAVFDQHRGCGYWLRDETDGTTSSIPASATIEVIEPADDDPSKDPVGTVRREQHGDGYSIWQQQGQRWWLCLFSTAPGNRGERLSNVEVIEFPVIGAVPGTPASLPEHATGGVLP